MYAVKISATITPKSMYSAKCVVSSNDGGGKGVILNYDVLLAGGGGLW